MKFLKKPSKQQTITTLFELAAFGVFVWFQWLPLKGAVTSLWKATMTEEQMYWLLFAAGLSVPLFVNKSRWGLGIVSALLLLLFSLLDLNKGTQHLKVVLNGTTVQTILIWSCCLFLIPSFIGAFVGWWEKRSPEVAYDEVSVTR